MKVCVKDLLRPAHILAFVFGSCPYRKFDGIYYRRSVLGTVLQLANVVLMTCISVYAAVFYLPEAFGERDVCSSLKLCSFLAIQTSHVFLSLWLAIHLFVWDSRTLRCLQLTDELTKTILSISNSKRQPFCFYTAMVWTIMCFVGFSISSNVNLFSITLSYTIFFTLYCETLLLEFVTVICIALDTVTEKLQCWEADRNYDINDLKRMQYLYLKAAYLSEVVDDAFGINWLISLFTESLRIVVQFNWVLKLSEIMVLLSDETVPIESNISFAYSIFRLSASMIRCFQICHLLHQPTVQRFKMVSILRGMITRNNDNEMITTMNEFSLQIALRKMQFTAGGFLDINLRQFVEIVGTWFTLLVIMVQLTEA